MARCPLILAQWGSGDAMHRSISLFRGPGHVCEWTNETFRDRDPRPVIGIPAREAFNEPEFAPLQRLMDLAFASGLEQWLEFGDGLFAALPRYQKGRVIGVAVVYEPSLVPLRRPRPELHRSRSR